ncbi:MAG: hypothetical protein ABUL42_00190 [Terricaulis silvestris]
MINKNNLEALRAIGIRRSEIRAELERLREEDSDLAIAETVLGKLYGDAADSVVFTTDLAVGKAGVAATLPRVQSARPRNQRELVIEALRLSKHPWLRTHELAELIAQEFSVDIPMRNLRPLLSVMKQEGDLIRDGRLVGLQERPALQHRRHTSG